MGLKTMMQRTSCRRCTRMLKCRILAGISDPVIDALIDKIIKADSRTSLTTACRGTRPSDPHWALLVPHWYKASHWLAYWDVFGRPATKPRYARGIPETWWYDRDKAAKIDQ